MRKRATTRCVGGSMRIGEQSKPALPFYEEYVAMPLVSSLAQTRLLLSPGGEPRVRQGNSVLSSRHGHAGNRCPCSFRLATR